MKNPNLPSNNNPESSGDDQFDSIIEVNYDKDEIPTPESERASGLKTVEQTLQASTPDQLVSGLSRVASTAELQLLAELLNKAQDAEFFEQRDKLLTAAEGSQFAQAMADHLRRQPVDEGAQKKLLDLQVQGAYRLKQAFEQAGDGTDYTAVREQLALKKAELGGRETAFIHDNGNYGVAGDNNLGYDTYAAQFNEADVLLEMLETNPAGARDFMDGVEQGRTDVRPPRMASEIPSMETIE